MTSTSAFIIAPTSIPVPRGAPIAADLALGLIRGVSRVAAALRRLAIPEAAHPLPARRVRQRVTEAAALRRHAQHMMGTDPRFAADLFAAADRHEREQ